MLRATPFLPGGMWFSLACFEAATPPTHAFHAWLAFLARKGIDAGRPEAVLESLPRAGERPFMAALPQALLASQQGPLAIIGHSDLAWVSSFVDVEDPWKSRASATSCLSPGKKAAQFRRWRPTRSQGLHM
jgi:hypothetical protein